jgi:hypothetical protein
MIDIRTAVLDTTKGLVAGGPSLPPFLLDLFSGVHSAHRYWRIIRKVKLYTDSGQWANLIAGHALNWVAGDSKVIQFAARCVAIAVFVKDAMDNMLRIVETYQDLDEAWNGKFVPSIPKRSEFPKGNFFFSASTVDFWQTKVIEWIETAKKIFFCLIRLMANLFLLSMHVLDAVECFIDERSSEYNQEIFALASQLRENEEIIDRLLKVLGSNWTSTLLIGKLSTGKWLIELCADTIKVGGESCCWLIQTFRQVFTSSETSPKYIKAKDPYTIIQDPRMRKGPREPFKWVTISRKPIPLWKEYS